MTGRVELHCVLCGTPIDSPETAAEHTQVCRPRWWYWWPRANPHTYALVALALGLFVGSLMTWAK